MPIEYTVVVTKVHYEEATWVWSLKKVDGNNYSVKILASGKQLFNETEEM